MALTLIVSVLDPDADPPIRMDVHLTTTGTPPIWTATEALPGSRRTGKGASIELALLAMMRSAPLPVQTTPEEEEDHADER